MTDEPTPALPVPNAPSRHPGEGEGIESEGANNPTADKTRLISLAEASEMYGFSHGYLRLLAERGRLNAFKVARNWVTTPADVEEYIRSRKKRGAYRSDIELDNDALS